MLKQNIIYWIQGSRPRTFPNAIAPILCGTGSALAAGYFNAIKTIGLIVMALAIIIGANYINDYADGVRGTDTDRVGPLRLVGANIFSPTQVKIASITSFTIAAFIGILLALNSSWWLLIGGILALVAAWNYTAGKNPYGYRGWGEVMVFLFFGLLAVLGSCIVIMGKINFMALLAAISMGLLSSSVLLVNNIRDIPTDRVNHKITLAVKIGDKKSRLLYIINLVISQLIGIILAVCYSPWFLLTNLSFPVLLSCMRLVSNSKNLGKKLIPGIGKTGLGMLIWAGTFFLACMLVYLQTN